MASALRAAPACITNVTLSFSGVKFGVPAGDNGGFVTNGNSLVGVGLLSLCTPSGCDGPEIIIVPKEPRSPNDPDIQCANHSTQIGVLTWKCDPSCDPSGDTHVASIIFPPNALSLSFHICINPDSNCGLYLGCFTAVACSAPPPESCRIEERFRIESYPRNLIAAR